jgi:hypothetical protein
VTAWSWSVIPAAVTTATGASGAAATTATGASGGVVGQRLVEAVETTLEGRLVEQGVSRGVGGEGAAVLGGTGGGGEVLVHGGVQEALVEIEDARPEASAEGVTARWRGLETARQPAQGLVLAGMLGPVARAALADLEFVKDDFEEEVGREGLRASLGVGGEQVGKVEGIDGAVNASGEVVGRQAGIEFKAFGVVVGPGLAEAWAGVSAALAKAFAARRGWRGRGNGGGGGEHGQGQ